MKTLNMAMIGAGRMGLAHARVLSGLAECRVVRVVDTLAQNAERVAVELGAKASTHLEDAFQPDVDAVIITTPTPTHAEVVEAAARAGKAIFVEKPIAESLEAGRRVVAAVERTGVPCQVGFQRRYDPAYVRAKEMIERGELGRLEGIRLVGRDPYLPKLDFLKTSGGLLVDMGIHDLDSARFLVGEVAEVYAVGGALAEPELKQYGLFDTAVATLRFESGAVGTLEVALRTAYGYDIRCEVLGEKGRIHIERDRRPDLTFYDERGGNFDRPRNFEQRFPEAYAAEMVAFARNLHAGKPLEPGVRDAWYSLRLAKAAQHALETGQVVGVKEFGGEL
ncbi:MULTISPECIES: Gfo/Idh/MocA family oxidoreductase [Thermaceae]|uniref:Scyllo-inositol 2-dehydrogenase (NAD(+)) n=1 Tax=Calidithermus roseus TaxID=1644118 RepID=A0A399F3R7_9DEIN|nr:MULTISPECIES: Gfo/Idh/MocA family oxidoreductase [Thermaceae]RIH89251.1 scyllo-inositol 2-dehydrogenase (NAD(+)) [Calidithermus roseus]